MLYAGLDLSRQRLDVHVLDEEGRTVDVLAVHPDADALRTLAHRVLRHGQEVSAVIESMTGSRFVHDTLERLGWDVMIADAVKAKGVAPLAAKTDKIDAHVLAELARRDLVPEIWLPNPAVRAERERARFRLHLVRHRSALKCRIHATLMTFGHNIPVSDLFGTSGRQLLAGLELPEPWARTLATSLAMVDELEERIDECGRELARLGADHPYIPLLLTIPGVGPLLAYTIASEIGDIRRFASPKEAHWLHGPVPARAPVGQPRLPRTAGQERAQVPALGPGGGCHPRRPRSALSRPLRAEQETPRPPAWREGRPDRHRPPAGRGHLARPHEERTVCPGKPRYPAGRLTTPVWNWAAGAASHATLSFRAEKAIEK
jgi:transposase